MYVTYTPEDGEKREWTFLPGRVRVSEQVMVEKRSGMRWDEWVGQCKLGNAAARRVLLWHLIRREENPRLRFEETPDFYADELLVELSVAELMESREGFLKSGGLDQDNGPQILTMLDEEIAQAQAKHGDDGGPGKATSRKSSTGTGG